MSEEREISADKLTKAYIKIRAERVALSAEFKSTEGLFFRTSKVKYWTSDWERMYEFILEHDIPELLDKRLNQTNLKQFLEENPDVMPKGLNIDNEYVISVRKK